MPLDKPKAPFSLPKLPYDDSALEPVVSAKTISFHHAKHHKAYIDNLNRLIAGTPYEQMDLEEIVIVDDTHHFMRHANQVRVNAAAAAYFDRKLNEALFELPNGSN